MTRELGYAPIVDLRKIMELNKWIVGASAFKNYGNAYQISELLNGVDTDLAKRLKIFSDLLNLNHLDRIEKEVQSLMAMRNRQYSNPLPELTVKPVINDFLREFGTIRDNHALFQYKLAKWQFNNMNYALSLISLQEALITYACKLEGVDWQIKDIRDEVKCNVKRILCKELSDCYSDIRQYRNAVAHSLKNDSSAGSIINKLRNALDVVGKHIGNS